MGTNHFKTQQEIWKYVADGGSVINEQGRIVRFLRYRLNYIGDLIEFEQFKPYIEPVKKTKVWRFEIILPDGNGGQYIQQDISYYNQDYADVYLKGYTKVPGSERSI